MVLFSLFNKVESAKIELSSQGVSLLKAGYPIVIVLHDYDLLQEGGARFKNLIQEWKENRHGRHH